MKRSLQLLLVFLLAAVSTAMRGEVKNGFDLSGALVPEHDILSGGPSRDGIPAIDEPRFVDVDSAHFLRPGDRVLGIARNGVAKAYPVAVLVWHEIVNDSFRHEPVVVTYCPLCGTGIAYLASVGDQELNFGVSGLLYNSDMLLYDRQTHSLWSQIGKQAVSGSMKGMRLHSIPLEHTSWSDWRERYPDSLVLSTDTGYTRDYTKNPYEGYEHSRNLFFPVQTQDQRYHPKELVLGVESDGAFKAYPFSELEKSVTPLRDRFAGQDITITYDRRHSSAVAIGENGNLLSAIQAYWFAWHAFHPDAEIYHAP